MSDFMHCCRQNIKIWKGFIGDFWQIYHCLFLCCDISSTESFCNCQCREWPYYSRPYKSPCLASVFSIAVVASFCCTIITDKQTYDHCKAIWVNSMRLQCTMLSTHGQFISLLRCDVTHHQGHSIQTQHRPVTKASHFKDIYRSQASEKHKISS